MRYRLTPVRMAISQKKIFLSIGNALEKRESLYTVGGNVNFYSHYEKQHGVSKKI